jgi:hypothetical protein
MNQKIKSSPASFLLWILMLIVGCGSLYGGTNLILDPSGKRLQIPLFFLTDSPFRSYLIPGLILFFVLGLFPLLSLYGLIFQPKIKALNGLNIYKQQHWGWTYALYTGIMLVIWMDVQIFWIGHSASVQSYFAFTGIIIIIVALLPGVQRKYTLNE